MADKILNRRQAAVNSLVIALVFRLLGRDAHHCPKRAAGGILAIRSGHGTAKGGVGDLVGHVVQIASLGGRANLIGGFRPQGIHRRAAQAVEQILAQVAAIEGRGESLFGFQRTKAPAGPGWSIVARARCCSAK
nr:hypothetical protein [Humidesulfovibrio mexicanus]